MRWPPPSDWPNAALSRQVLAAPHRWHIQETSTGPTILMLHGAGGSTHSMRGLMAELRESYHVVALDLPGQGFTQLGARHRCGLNPMAEDIKALCDQEDWHPDIIIGHSAGCALALRLSQMMLSPRGQPLRIAGINPALDTFDGIAGVLFPALAKMLAAIPFSASLFSATSASPARIKALIRGTGSELDAEGLDLYRRLVADRDHVDATLLMMSQWSLTELSRALPEITSQVLFLAGGKDGAVPAKVSHEATKRMRDARVIDLPSLGHLAHEEAPKEVAAHIRDFLET